MMTEENNDLKETLTREKVKRELLHTHRHELLAYILSSVCILYFEILFCWILDCLDRIDLPVRIIAGILYFIYFVYIIAHIVCIIRIKMNKFYVVKDILVDKKEQVKVRLKNYISMRKFRIASPRFYNLCFSKMGTWEIPARNYKWSEFYGLQVNCQIYYKSEATDWFYIAYTCRNIEMTAFNAEYFEYNGECDANFCKPSAPIKHQKIG